MIVINFKNYVYGKNALNLAKKIKRYLPKAIVAASSVDVGYIKFHTNLQVYAQHIDYQQKGRNTGFLIPPAIKSHGASGTLLNHSEHSISKTEIYKTLVVAKKIGLKVILCASSLRGMKSILNISKAKPHAIAFEDPKLIAKGKSITKYRTHSIKKFVKTLKGTKIIPICGAGMSSAEDVKEAFSLGCKGVLISSAVADSKNPEKFLKTVSQILK